MDGPGAWSDISEGPEDSGGYRLHAGCMTKVWGDREHEGCQKPEANEWPGW